MIETTIKEIEGVRFYSNIRILEPDDKLNGVPVHYVERRHTDPELLRFIRLHGLRKVGADISRRADIYAQYLISYFQYKTVDILANVYWHVIRWSYDNLRMFKQIPEYRTFSWRYFTPYTWFKGVPK